MNHTELIERLRDVGEIKDDDAYEGVDPLVLERRDIWIALGNQPEEPITTDEIIRQIEQISRIAGKGAIENAALVMERDALSAEVARMREALQGLHDDTVEYVTLNKLHDADGSLAINNHWMKQARAARAALAALKGAA